MTNKKALTLADLPEPSPELHGKAWRKAVIVMAARAQTTADDLVFHINGALRDMPDSPERDEILRDWRAGVEAYGILAASVADMLEDLPAGAK